MLVITRKTGESVIIGNGIEVSIVEIQKGAVKIAISAPREVTIMRKEIIKEVENTNLEASQSSGMYDLDALSGELKDRMNK